MKKFLAIGFVAFLFVACGSDDTQCDNTAAVGACQSVQICCDSSGNCSMNADGTSYSCNASNCAAAEEQVVAHCNGGDVLLSGDLNLGDTAVGGAGCSAAASCCATLAAQYGAGYQAQCDALNGQTDAVCNQALTAWHNAGFCK